MDWSFLNSCAYTDDERKSLPHDVMTRDEPWNPRIHDLMLLGMMSGVITKLMHHCRRMGLISMRLGSTIILLQLRWSWGLLFVLSISTFRTATTTSTTATCDYCCANWCWCFSSYHVTSYHYLPWRLPYHHPWCQLYISHQPWNKPPLDTNIYVWGSSTEWHCCLRSWRTSKARWVRILPSFLSQRT